MENKMNAIDYPRKKWFNQVGKDLTDEIFDGETYTTTQRRIDKIVVHCSYSPQGRGDGAREIDRWHTEKGWDGIGYHYVVLENGDIQKGRWIDKAGAHAKGYNGNTIGICRIGGWKGNHDTTMEQKFALMALCELLRDEYDLETSDIVGHKELPSVAKECPCMDMDKFRELVDSQSML